MNITFSVPGGGANFLKQEARELLLSDDDTEKNVPKIVTSEPARENVRSILKTSPQRTTADEFGKAGGLADNRKSLRVANTSNATREERRIQFHIEEKKEEKQMEPSSTSISEDEEVNFKTLIVPH